MLNDSADTARCVGHIKLMCLSHKPKVPHLPSFIPQQPLKPKGALANLQLSKIQGRGKIEQK